ncbi:MAG: MBL fold metallo-hydrolase [Lachnospiraceae bacterium]|jgi:L-ascorbate metabolism protein UlaG (beta-lactamase superfamily)|nr:MBL fold metallo-hydrolase [Lachnospiraceae bacterium]
MKINYLGHSCFAIEEDGYRIIFDPYKNGTVPGCGNLDEEADLVICSHGHDDHNAADLIRKREGSPCPFALTTIHSLHDDHGGKLRGTNDITIVRGRLSAAHMGDIGCDLTDEQYALLKGVDVLMIPVGGFFTIDAAAARKMADRIGARVTIPMHYKGKGFGYPVIGKVDQFTKISGNVTYNGSELTVDDSTPVQTAVMEARYWK